MQQTLVILFKSNKFSRSRHRVLPCTDLVDRLPDLVADVAEFHLGERLEEVLEGHLSLQDLLQQTVGTEDLAQDHLQALAFQSGLSHNKEDSLMHTVA